MLRFKRTLATLMLATLTLGLASGCMDLSTAPVTHAQTVAIENGRAAQTDGLIGSVVGVVDGLLKLVFKVVNIVGSIGGSLTNGRWRIDVPAGAVDGNAQFGVGVTSGSSATCELVITPIEKNHFANPVRLTADCSSLSPSELRNAEIEWFDPATSTWVPVAGSTVDMMHRTVSAPLQHFSTYRVGTKAGW